LYDLLLDLFHSYG